MICKNLLEGEQTIHSTVFPQTLQSNLFVSLVLEPILLSFPSFCGASQQAERETDQHESTAAPLKLKGGENHWGMISGTSCREFKKA